MKYNTFFNYNEHLSFWKKWASLHVKLFRAFELKTQGTNEDHIERTTVIFMQKRMALISSLLQAFKINKTKDLFSQNFLALITEHDSVFKEHLKELSKDLEKEMKKLHTRKKATEAYSSQEMY